MANDTEQADLFHLGLRKSFLYRAQAVFLGRLCLNSIYLSLWVMSGLGQNGIFLSSRFDLFLIFLGFFYAIICHQYKGHQSYGRWLHFITLVFDLGIHLFFTRNSQYLLSPLMAVHPFLSAAFLLLFHNPLLLIAPLSTLPIALMMNFVTIGHVDLTNLLNSLAIIAGLDAVSVFFIHLPHSKEHRLLRSMVALEKKLKNLALIEERQRIAREFHDGVGAKMAGIVMQCDYVQMIEGANARLFAEISEIKESAIESIDDMRRSISFLNGDFEIQEQADLIIEKIAQRHRINIQKNNTHLLQVLNIEQQIACCRIIQEALINVVKHAKAQSITVAVETTKGQLSLAVLDDGRGFDPSTSQKHHFGIKNMKKRAELIGGQLACYSKPDLGTQIVLEIFLP